ncbi:MAG TPA: BMP family ABC transporter substrate-binding protein, partial [Caldilineaceae bacterium]|nr:BMP family ABC transporter substrate-binding protein [Caldilineaceae bacterium]
VFVLVGACAAPAAPAASGGGDAAASGGGDAAPTAASSEGSESAAAPLKVILFINGVLGDKSFFDSAQRGVDRAVKELGIEAKTIEAGTDETTWEAALVDALENEEADLFIMGTFQLNGYLTKLADRYPDTKFVIYDAPVDYTACTCANVYSILYKQNEGSYLAGVYAAAMTTQQLDGMNPDAIIGSVGGQEIPVILDFMVGYEQGAQETNPDIQIIRQFA